MAAARPVHAALIERARQVRRDAVDERRLAAAIALRLLVTHWETAYWLEVCAEQIALPRGGDQHG